MIFNKGPSLSVPLGGAMHKASTWMPQGYMMDTWVGIDREWADGATGTCRQQCRGIPFLPFHTCPSEKLKQVQPPARPP